MVEYKINTQKTTASPYANNWLSSKYIMKEKADSTFQKKLYKRNKFRNKLKKYGDYVWRKTPASLVDVKDDLHSDTMSLHSNFINVKFLQKPMGRAF